MMNGKEINSLVEGAGVGEGYWAGNIMTLTLIHPLAFATEIIEQAYDLGHLTKGLSLPAGNCYPYTIRAIDQSSSNKTSTARNSHAE